MLEGLGYYHFQAIALMTFRNAICVHIFIELS
jgi:hypothetical protein